MRRERAQQQWLRFAESLLDPYAMPKEPRDVVQLVTRIPGFLRRAMKVQCVSTNRSMMDFVTQAIAEKLARDAAPQRRRR